MVVVKLALTAIVARFTQRRKYASQQSSSPWVCPEHLFWHRQCATGREAGGGGKASGGMAGQVCRGGPAGGGGRAGAGGRGRAHEQVGGPAGAEKGWLVGLGWLAGWQANWLAGRQAGRWTGRLVGESN